MTSGAYLRASIDGFASMARAVAGWSGNPLRAIVLRRLWGPMPWIPVFALAAVSAAVEHWFPDLRLLAGVFPPLTFVAFAPGSVLRFLISGAALLGFVGAWRIRTVRTSPGPIDGPWPTDAPPGALAFEAAALPLGCAALIAGAAVVTLDGGSGETVAPLADTLRRLVGFVMIFSVTGGIAVTRRQLGTAFGQILSAAFTIWALHLAIGFAAPWVMAWWEWVPGLGDRDRPVAMVHLALDAAIVSVAWTTIRSRFAEGVAWRVAPTENPNDSQ